MANPYGDKAKSSNRLKFKSITGKSGGGQKFDGDKQGAPAYARRIAKSGNYAVPGKKGASRADKYARGGRTKGTNVNIAIVIPKGGDEKAAPAPVPIPIPAGGPPPGAGGPPPGMEGPPPMPMMRKHGGRLPTAGAESGVGRLQKARIAKKN